MSRTHLDRAAWMVCVVVLGLTSAARGVDPDPSGFNKPRFISFDPNQQEALTSIRIWMVSLHHVVPPYASNASPSIPFTLFEGQSVWVGPPAEYLESSATPVPFKLSKTQCMPHYQDWSTVGLLHVTGSQIVPSSIYEVEQLSGVCQGQEETCADVSARLEIRTTRWGDIVDPFNPPSITAQPNIGDCQSMVNKFRNFLGAPIKVRCYQAGYNAFGEFSTQALTHDMNFAHIAAVFDAFRGSGYPHKMGKCTGSPTYPATGACTEHTDCGGANGAGPCVLGSTSTCSGAPNGPCRWNSDCIANSSCISLGNPLPCCTGEGRGSCSGEGTCELSNCVP